MWQPHPRGREYRCKPRHTLPKRKRRRRQRGRTGLPSYACRTAAMGVSRLEISFRRVRVRLVAGLITSGVRMTSRRSRARRRKVLLIQATRTPGPCQVRSKTESPCLGRAEVEIRGIPFCEACAREQEAYFAIGELTQEEAQGFGSKPLAEALERMRRERAVSRKGIEAEMHQGLSGVDEIEPLALSTS